MANGAFNFKDSNGNIVSFISGSGSDIIMSGGTLNLSSMTGLTLGNLTMEGTVETASFAPNYLLTSSFESYTGTTDTIIGSLQTSTSSLNSFTSSAESRLDSIEGVSGSYATTGSNTFNGNLTVTGYIDTQELRTTYISSSILYRSGSTKFGDESTDNHEFTGSLLVSGSNHEIIGNFTFSKTDDARIYIKDTGDNSTLVLRADATNEIYTDTADDLQIYTSGNQYGQIYLKQSNGFVGVNQINPTERFEVNGTIASIATSDPTIKVQGSDVNYQGRMRWNTTNNVLEFLTRHAGTYYTDTLVLKEGKVGIGNSDPSTSLHIKSASPSVFFDDTSTTGTRTRFQLIIGDVGTTQSGIFGFNNTSGTSLLDVLTINENRSVGIGLNAPPADRMLQIHNPGFAYARFGLTNTTTGAAGTDGLIFQMEENVAIIKNQENADFRLGTNGSETQVVLTAAGSLVVNNSGVAHNDTIVTRAFNSGTASNWGESTYQGMAVTIPNVVGTIGQIGFVNQDSANAAAYGGIGMVMTNGSGVGLADLILFTKGSGANVVSTERVRVTSAGNVGVGSNNPTNKLEVDGGSSAVALRISTTNTGAGVASLILANSSKSAFNDGIIMSHGGGYTTVKSLTGSTLMTWDVTNTRVGIGELTSAAAKLHVRESVLFTNQGTDSGQSYVPTQSILTVTTDGDGTASSNFATNAVFKVGIGGGDTGNVTTEWFRVNLNGRIGINTSNPGNFSGLTFASPIVDVVGTLNLRGRAVDGVSIINMGGETYRKAAIYTSIQDSAPYLGFSVGSSGTSSSTSEMFRLASNGVISTHSYAYGGTLGFSFNSSGYAQIGINTNSVGSEVILINNLTSGGSASVLQYRTSGTIEGSLEGTSSGLAISNVSDYRKKTDIRDLSGSLDIINNLQPRLFKFKDGFGKPTDKDFVGFIAHEIQSILPDSVIGTKDAIYTQEDIDGGVVGYNVGDPRYQTVSYTSNEIITHLVGSIKEQQTIINDLKLRLEQLENN